VASIAILRAIAALHVYWAVDGTLGKNTAVPERTGGPVLAPIAALTSAVAGCLALAAALIAMRTGLLSSAALGARPHLSIWGLAPVFHPFRIQHFRALLAASRTVH